MTFSDQRRAAFDYASDTTKQLITLATGIIAVSITFSKDIIGNTTAHRGVLIAAWITYLLSIVFGVWALLAMTGELQPRGQTSGDPSIRKSNVTMPSIVQILSFIVATGLLIAYAVLTFKTKATPR
jgi:hypothetical protein